MSRRLSPLDDAPAVAVAPDAAVAASAPGANEVVVAALAGAARLRGVIALEVGA